MKIIGSNCTYNKYSSYEKEELMKIKPEIEDKNLAFQIMLLYESELKDKLPNKEQIEKRLEDARKDNNPEEIKFLETILKYIE